jgi:hypothetical protein
MMECRSFKQYLSQTLISAVIGIGIAGCVSSATNAGKKDSQAAQPQASQPQAANTQFTAFAPARVRLISQEQYFNTLVYLFGPDIKVDAHFPPFHRTDGLLQIGASSAGVTAGQMELFQRTALEVSRGVVSEQRRDFLIPCKPKDDKAADAACATRFLSRTARILHRRPVSPARLQQLVDQAAASATKLKDFYAGLGVALEGALVSPEFLFIVERTEPDPAHPGHQRLDPYSIASRMSFFLWNAAPDDELLDAAAKGQLSSRAGRERVLDTMLASPRLVTGTRAFFDDMFGFDDFANLAKDPLVYPSFSGSAGADAREQTLRTVVDQLLTRDADYRDLYTTHDTFISPSLATLYRVPAPPGWSPYRTPEGSPRVGLLTQISFLSAHSHPGRSSATLRGKALRELLLCQIVPRPPPNVDFSLLEDSKSVFHTARERMTAHRKNPVCAGCHKITDPIGLSLENFDGAGQYRENEKGAPIDASGDLDGVAFSDPVGLAKALHDNPALPACLVKRTFSYATGGSPTVENRPQIEALNSTFAASGYRFRPLLRAIVTDDAFVAVADPRPATPTQRTAAAQ